MTDPRVGRPLRELTDTPFPVVDIDVLDGNIDRLQRYCDSHGVRLWPHAKTHKSAWIAERQLAAGAYGLTFAKSSEAEALGAVDAERILIAYPLIGGPKAERACALAKLREVTVMLDSATAATGLADAARRNGVELRVLVELEAGLGRVGVAGAAAAVELGAHVERLPGLRLCGIGCYPGQLREADELERGLPEVAALLEETVDRFDRAGLCRDRVSAGSTKTALRIHECPAVNESRAGTYVLGDLSDEPPLDFALTVQATVVSRREHAAVIDAGAKTLSADLLLCRRGGGFGRLAAVGAELSALFDEHGVIPDPEPGSLQIGELVRVIPNHCVAVMNLFDEVVVVQDDVVVAVEPVAGRGAVR